MNRAKCIGRGLIAGATLAAMLGLAACGGAATQSSNSSASSEANSAASAETSSETSSEAASAQVSSVEAYNLTSSWVGMDDTDIMAYYYESSAKDAGAVLIYHTGDNTYERWIGALSVPADDKRQITDAESGETIAFTITSEGEDGTITIETDNGLVVSLSPSPSPIEEMGSVLDEVSSYASKVGEPSAAPSAAELGGEYVVQINSDGLGQVSYTQNGESLGYGDSAFTHANAGDDLTLSAKPADGWKFVKWTQDDKEISADAEVKVTISGDVEYRAVFEEK